MADPRKHSTISVRTTLLATAGIGLLCIVVSQRARILWRLRNYRNPLGEKCITVIETPDECQKVVNTLKRHCHDYQVLGFDCEWITVGGKRRPVALLQLSSQKGLCALFRLCNLKQIPKSLRELLEDDAVIKVGVGPQDDAHKLAYDYGVGVASTLDLRYFAAVTNEKPEGLAKMAKALLHVQMDKNWRLSCSDWEANVLNEKQLEYAANDALAAVKIFEALAKKIEPKPFWNFNKVRFRNLQERLEPFYDTRFKDGFLNMLTVHGKRKVTPYGKKFKQQQIPTRNIYTRSKALYDNCLLQAPDGELLCTIDARKAQWYLDQDLGVSVTDDPLTVRLNFEPSGRAVGDVGRYYQIPKENRCVVCGRFDALSRKNVVPREYRKHFPVVMKSHTSHDVLLLCNDCHQLSNIFDIKIRLKLAEQCNAPFSKEESSVKYIEIPELKRLKSAARALLQTKNELPAERRDSLKSIVLHHYKVDKLTDELVSTAANIDTTQGNKNYSHHGKKVVHMYQNEFGGLCELEKLWRQNFLNSMKPKYLPELWNVNHNASRLEIRAQEGRVNKHDLIVAGIEGVQSAGSRM